LKHKEDGEVIEAIESYLGLSIEAEDLDIETLVSNIASTLADLKAGPRKKIT
jgi:hypothetical protein